MPRRPSGKTDVLHDDGPAGCRDLGDATADCHRRPEPIAPRVPSGHLPTPHRLLEACTRPGHMKWLENLIPVGTWLREAQRERDPSSRSRGGGRIMHGGRFPTFRFSADSRRESERVVEARLRDSPLVLEKRVPLSLLLETMPQTQRPS